MARHGVRTALFLSASLTVMASAVHAQSLQSLASLSLEDLGNIEITSVSKAPQSLNTAAAVIYVITHEDIMRSGAMTIPEMLRLAPNLQVAQTSPSTYNITARGLSGNASDQNFPDKLLVLIDGRSVYNPLFSGMYWDMQDVPPEDIERIEVISGPGATLWGANAVNGVINIITRKSSDTQGGSLELGAGNQYASASLQYGGALGDNVTYRVYAKAFKDNSLANPGGTSARDGWSKPQGGFRLDWTPGADQVTLEGDIYDGRENQSTNPDQLIAGGNLVANWTHPLPDGSSLQVLAYYDHVWRFSEGGNGGLKLDTYDLEIQQNKAIGSWNNLVWGVGERYSNYDIVDRIGIANSLLFRPESGQLNLADVFAQDQISLSDDFDLTLGLKLEDDPYSGWSAMPTIRASWKIAPDSVLWAAASQAIRSPTPFDTHVIEDSGPTPFLVGSPDFLPERLTAYELGYRAQLSDRASISLSAFDSVYDDLKSIQPMPVTLTPLRWGNGWRGNVYGIEAWGTYQPTDWWRLSAGANIQTESFRSGPNALLGREQNGNDPHHQASLRSSMNLGDSVTFDTDFRYVGILPNPHVPAYVEMNARLGWAITDRLELSISGFNLLHDRHLEYAPGDEIRRSFFVDTRWKF